MHKQTGDVASRPAEARGEPTSNRIGLEVDRDYWGGGSRLAGRSNGLGPDSNQHPNFEVGECFWIRTSRHLDRAGPTEVGQLPVLNAETS